MMPLASYLLNDTLKKFIIIVNCLLYRIENNCEVNIARKGSLAIRPLEMNIIFDIFLHLAKFQKSSIQKIFLLDFTRLKQSSTHL